jgi:ABC-2 type transport system permease protein
MMRTLLTLAAKDFRLLLRDRSGFLLAFALPIVLVTIFAAAMGSMGGDASIGKIQLFVEDLDQSARSKAFVDELGKSPGLSVKAETNVRRRVADGKAPAALLIPSGYEADLTRGETPKLVLYRDPGQTIEQQIVAGNLLPALLKSSGKEIGRGMMRRGLKAFGFPAAGMDQAERIMDQTWSSISTVAQSAPDGNGDGAAAAKNEDSAFNFGEAVPKLLGVQVEDVAGGKDPSQKTAGQSHAVSGIAVMMLLFSLTACGGTILEEEAQGTLQRLRLSPAASRAILLGKMLFTMEVGFAQLVILFVYGGVVFSIPVLRDPLALCVLSLALAAAATGFGLLLGVTCRTRKQLEGLSTLIILAMAALGGSWFPLIMTPAWYQNLGHFTLNAWAMDGYQGIFWYGKNLSGIAIDVLVLIAIAVVTTMLALRGWKRRFEATA